MAIASNVLEFKKPASKKLRKDFSGFNTGLAFGKFLTNQVMKELSGRFESPVDEKGFRDKALFHIMSSTGLRSREIINLKISDLVITPDGKKAFKYIRKGGKVYYTIPSEKALCAIEDYHKSFDLKSDYFFLTLPTNKKPIRSKMCTRTHRRIIESWNVLRADNKKASPHSLRHTVGQRIFEKKGSIAVQKVLGHSTPNCSEKFYTAPYFDGSEVLIWE